MVIIEPVYSDIFTFKGLIAITVNCRGAMGKGIALQAKKKYPDLYRYYKGLCDKKEIKPGRPRMVKMSSHKYPFLLFPTKDDWRNPSKYEWIETGLKKIKENEDKITKLALPPLGCGNGQLEWEKVRDLIIKYLDDADFETYIYIAKPF